MPVKVPGAQPRDGVSVTWSTLPGKPTTFAPSPHKHPWSDITDTPTTYPPAPHTHAWADITGKPASFTPSAHTHLWADITDKPTSFAPSAHTHPWTDVTGKPATYPPSAHTHLWADITDKPTTFAPAAHTHSGLLQLIGNVTVSETTLLSLALGMKRMALTLSGVATTDRLTFAPTGLATTGCEAVNVYASAANQVTVSYFTPALGLGVAYSIPLAVYRIT